MNEEYRIVSKNIEAITNESISWLEKQKNLNEEIASLVFGFKEIQFSVPLAIENLNESYNDEFVPPWFYLISEAEQELDSAKMLMMIGMYKDSLRALRSFIELNIFAIYFFVKKDRQFFTDWISGKVETPSKGLMLKEILENSQNIRKLNSELLWKNEIYNLYRDLSKFVHTQGVLGSFISLRNSNQISFNERGLDYCIQCLKRGINLMSQGLVANFTMTLHPVPMFEKFAFSGPAGGFLNKWEVERISKIFSEKQLRVLKEISNNDEKATSLVEWVNSMDDLSREDILKSFETAVSGFPDKKEELNNMLENGKIEDAFMMLKAMQKAFLGATTPLMNEIYLGIERGKDGVRIVKREAPHFEKKHSIITPKIFI